MESLAFLITILLLILLLSGPICLLLTIGTLREFTRGTVFNLGRRVLVSGIGFIGIFMCFFFLTGSVPIFLKFIALLSIAIHAWAIDREYNKIFSSRFRRDPNGPRGQS